MSAHRYPCDAEAPDSGVGGHEHVCMHDAEPKPSHDTGRLIEHKCECGEAWIKPEWQPRPPPDLSWINTTPPKRVPWWKRRAPQGTWRPFGPI